MTSQRQKEDLINGMNIFQILSESITSYEMFALIQFPHILLRKKSFLDFTATLLFYKKNGIKKGDLIQANEQIQNKPRLVKRMLISFDK